MQLTTSAVRLTAIFFAGFLALSTQSGCSKFSDSKSSAAKSTPLTVHAIRATPTNEMLWVETLGETEGAQQVEIRAQVSGTLKDIAYTEGETVKAGQTLFVIDDAPYISVLHSAKAAVTEARASLEKAELDCTRYEQLFKANAASRKQFDDALSAKKIAQAQLAQAIAKQSDAQVDVDRTRVKAPNSGVASRSELNLGALVNASSTRLATLTQPEKLRVKFQLSERDLIGKSIQLSNPIRLYDANRREIQAKLDYVSQQIDVSTSTRTLRASVAENSALVPGQLVSVQLATEELSNVFRIPQKSVQQLPDGSYQVFTAVNGKVHPVSVKVGQWRDTDWIVLSGIKSGDLILIDQIQRLREGLAVTVEEISKAVIP